MDRQKEIFISNMKYYINISKKSQKEIAEAIGVPVSTFSTWMVGKALPRMGKVEALANYFGCTKSDLIEKHDKKEVFSPDEVELIRKYRKADATTKEMINRMLLFTYIQEKEGGQDESN